MICISIAKIFVLHNELDLHGILSFDDKLDPMDYKSNFHKLKKKDILQRIGLQLPFDRKEDLRK